MAFWFLVFLLLFGDSWALVPKGGGKLALDLTSASESLAKRLLSFFDVPPGKVAFVKGKRVWVSFGKGKPFVKPGTVLVVYRPAEPVVDPDTGQVFPGIDEEVALFRVKGEAKGFVFGEVFAEKRRVEKGYRVRFPDVIPVKVECEDKKVCQVAELSIAQEPRFEVVESCSGRDFCYRVRAYVVAGEKPTLVFSLSFDGGPVIVAYSHEVRKVRSVSTAMLLQGATEGPVKRFGNLIAARVFKADYRVMASGDLDGDKVSEFILAGKGRVDVYKLKGKQFVRFASYNLGRRGSFYRFLRVYGWDADGDGRDEVYVSAVFQDIVNGNYKAYADSFVLVLDGNRLKRVKRFDFLLRVADLDGKRVLLGQRVGEYTPFEGPMFRVLCRDGVYRLDTKLPKYIRKIESIYGWALGDVNGDGKDELVDLDGDVLEVRSLNGTLLWESPEGFGPFTHLFFYQTPRFVKIPAMKNYEPEEVAVRRVVPRRIEIMYFPKENRYAVLTVANDEKKFVIAGIKILTEHEGINGRVVKVEKVAEGTVYSSYFDVVWETPKYAGVYGEDFAVGDYNGDGVLDIAFLGYLKRSGKTRVDVYRLPGM